MMLPGCVFALLSSLPFTLGTYIRLVRWLDVCCLFLVS